MQHSQVTCPCVRPCAI
ncbi:hypothetical protein F383_04288 [Gossypium arboreum]|uniref:Uncharacterized protein n=1 Tax=Gossypium arboreum TaxID=29729 RepID=A0A0B0P8Y9_GOSAR|nr:hypothetical protein F383_04288 [Gossypium arboreum]